MSHSGSAVTEQSFCVTLFVRLTKYPQCLYICVCVRKLSTCITNSYRSRERKEKILEISLLFSILLIYSFIYCHPFPWNVVIGMTLWYEYFYFTMFSSKHASLWPLIRNFHFNLCIIPMNLMCYNLLTYHPPFGNSSFCLCLL